VSTGRDGHGTDLPSGIVLSGNYPNPFERETQIAFTLSAPMDVAVTVYDALGRRVTELYSGALSAGEHQLPWDASTATGQTVTSGVYFYRVTAGRSAQTGRMLVVR
jgi:flagellar hook assembly protein FlgD